MLGHRLPTITTAFAGVLLAGTSHLTPNVVVHPTGVFPTDHQAVQAAVNQGGVVLLKAVDTGGHPSAFNFGPAAIGGGLVLLVLNTLTYLTMDYADCLSLSFSSNLARSALVYFHSNGLAIGSQ